MTTIFRVAINSFSGARTLRDRVLVVLIVVPAGLGTALYLVPLFPDFLPLSYFMQQLEYWTLILLLFSTTIVSGVVLYLQGGFTRRDREPTDPITGDTKVGGPARSVESPKQLHERVVRLEEKMEQRPSPVQTVSEDDQSRMTALVVARIREAASDEFLEQIRKDVSRNDQLQALGSSLEKLGDRTIFRLVEETSVLTRRGNINLAFGSATALFGIGVLFFFLLSPSSADTGLGAFVREFVPRLSVVILIEVFAYFFLRLYSKYLDEIKYFQNEITNIECQQLALRTSIELADEEAICNVIRNLSETERNYVLQKGQTTVELEREKMKGKSLSELVRGALESGSRRQ